MSGIRSLGTVLLVTLFVNGPFWGAWIFWRETVRKKQANPEYYINRVVSITSGDELLRPAILAEWLDLSVDKPLNLYAIDLNKASKLLKKHLLVKKVKVFRDPPSTLVIESEIRKPVAFVGERSNIAIDKEGNVFPFSPFFTPKKLPKLFIGKRENFPAAQKVLSWLIEKGRLEQVEFIDVRKAEADSLGEREVIMSFQGRLLVRLNPDSLEKGLQRFFKLNRIKAGLLDLRIDGLGFLKEDL